MPRILAGAQHIIRAAQPGAGRGAADLEVEVSIGLVLYMK